MRSFILLVQLLLFSGLAFANPSGINLSGKISLSASNTALTANDVDFKIRVLSPDGCILYSEKFLNVDLSATAGVFNLTIGNGTALYNAWDATLGTANSKASLIKVFNNASIAIPSGLTQYPGEVCAGGAYTPADGDTRKVVIEFDPTGSDNSANYVALSPFHRIRSVPYAMLADKATDADKLGGVAAANYAKTADLATAVPGAETDPNVQAFAKTAVTGLTAGTCGAGKVLTYNGTSLECVTDSGGGGGGAIATNTVAGSVLVDTGSYVSLNLGTGAIDVKDMPTSKITGLVAALADTLKLSTMPASCGAGEALVWTSPSNVFSCYSITVDTAHVTGFDAAVDARIAADTTKLPVAGGTMTGNINMSNNQLSNVGYVHLQNKAADPGGFVAGNEGFVWYNSTDKLIKYYNGTVVKALPGYAGTCADGEVLKWNNASKIWACGVDAGASGGADATEIRGVTVNATAPTAGQFLKYVGTEWVPTSMPVCTADQVMLFNGSGVATCTAISGLTNTAIAVAAAIDRSKLASGTMNHVLINDGTGVMSSEAQLAVSRGGTGQSTYTDGQLLIGNSTGNTLSKATLTQGTGITITNGNGTITIAADAAGSIVDGSIVDADVNAAAAIDRTKLANGTANRVVINTTGGVMADAAAITAGRALISDVNGIPTHSAVTGTELGYVSGVTSAIQTQLDALTTGAGNKVAKAGDTMTGNLVMNAESAVRFADNNSDHYIALKSPATVAADVTFTLPAADGTAGYVLKTDGSGNLDWVAPAAAPGDASYAAKGIVRFDTDAATSGVNVAAGLASVNTGVTANKIVKLDGSAKLPAVDGSALTNLDVGAITSAVGKWFTYLPNGAACADGGVLKWDNATSHWICGTDAGAGGGVDAVTIRSAAVSATTPTEGAFMKFTTGAWTPTFMPSCGADDTLTFDVTGAAACTPIAGLVNSQIAAGAAIARTKLASGTINHVLINDGSGVMSSEAQLSVTRGGTGQSTYTDGQLLIGNSTGNTLSKATLTQGTGITITNGNGTITIAADPVSSIVDDSIVNADINTAAAIDRTKLANGTANRVVINTTGGVMSEAAAITANSALISDANGIPTHSATVSATELGYLDGVTSAVQTQLDAKVAKAGDTMTGNLVMNAQNAVRFADSDSTNYIGLRSPAAVGTDVTFTLPATDGTANQVLKTDGSGNLGWVALPAGTVDASYAAKGVVQLDTDLATSGLAVTAGVIKVNTGITANQIVKLDGSAKLPAVDGSALTNIDVQSIVSATGKYFKYMPNGVECADGEILKWVAATDRWICGTAADLGAITSVVAGTGLDVNTVSGAATVSVEAELGALNALATTGYVQRTGAATYSTTTGNTLASNNTVVTRDGSGVSGFYGVGVQGATAGTATIQAPTSFTNYTLTLPTTDGASGEVLSTDGSGVLSWVNPSAGAGDFMKNGSVDMTGAFKAIDGAWNTPSITFASQTNTGLSNSGGTLVISAAGTRAVDISATSMGGNSSYSPLMRLGTGANNTAATPTYSFNGDPNTGMYNSGVDALSFATNGTEALTINASGNVGIGTSPGAKLDVKGAIRMSGATSGYTGFQPAAVAGSTVWTLPAADGSPNYVLKTDGSGNLGWVALPAGTVDASYAAKGVVQLDTDLATSGLAVTSGVIKVNTGITANQIVKLDGSAKLPAVDGSALTGLDVAAVTSGSGKWFSYKPDGTECADGEILKWVAATDRWICGTVGGVTSVVAGTGLDVNTVTGTATVSVEAELGALNALATTGYVQRTGAATYSTTTGNTLASNNTVVTRDGSGMSGFYGVGVQGATAGTVSLRAPSSFTNYSLTLPNSASPSDGYFLSGNMDGTTAWTSPANAFSAVADNLYASSGSGKFPTSAGSFLSTTNFHQEDGRASYVKLAVANTATRDQHVYFGAVAVTGGANYNPTMVWGTTTGSNSYAERMRISSSGYLGVGTDNPGSMLDVKGAIRMSGATSGYNGFQAAAVAGSTVWTLPSADGTAGYVLKTDGAGNLGWVALPGAATDASYAAKGVVQFDTDAATSGMTVTTGVAKVNTGTGINQILKFTTAATLPALDGSALTALNATNISSGTLAVARGGTGQTTYTNGQLLIGNTTGNTLTKATLTAGTGISITNGTGSITIASSGSASDITTGTLGVANGGTGAASFTANGLVMSGATGTSALAAVTCAATGRMLEWTGTTWGCSADFLSSGSPGSKVNYVLMTGGNAGVGATVAAAGSSAFVDLTLQSKGTSAIILTSTTPSTGSVRTDVTLNVNGTYIEKASAEGSGSVTLPVTSNIYRHVLANATAATLTLPPCPVATTATSFSLTVKVKQSAAGTGTITWAGPITWDSATIPDPTTVANGVTIYQFLCIGDDSPATWYGMQVWKN